MSSIWSNKSFWQTSSSQSMQTGQSEEFLAQFSNNTSVNLQTPLMPGNTPDYMTDLPQPLSNWPAPTTSLDDIEESAANFWQPPQEPNNMVYQPANYDEQLSSLSAESSSGNQFNSYHSCPISNHEQDSQETTEDLRHFNLNGERQQMQAEMMKELDDLRQQISTLQGK